LLAPQGIDALRLRDLIVCPACRSLLLWSALELRCTGCQQRFPVRDQIPLLTLDLEASAHDELGHHASAHKRGQSKFFDTEVSAEFEISRPHNLPRLHRWLLREKFRLGSSGLDSIFNGANAVTVCGGSGLDAEFLARRGCRVIASDISFGAALRCRERARRHDLPIVSIVADVGRLPFRDQSVDLVYVHDGLHHLERPFEGLAEMARIASRAVSITEPAQAFATSIAIRVGLAREVEEAGNRVERFRSDDIAARLQSSGMRVVKARRYAMFYRHHPGPVAKVLSLPGLGPLAELASRSVVRGSGRFGNKLTVQAVRDRI
jgi:uncharacterized protein YbaR (Trm112 family)